MPNRSLTLLLISNALASVGTGIAMIAIPWFLASQPAGGGHFATLATIVNIALFVATPLVGPVIDHRSRRALMIQIRLIFMGGVIVCGLIYVATNDSMLPLMLYYVLGNTFYAFNIPLRSAYVQELFTGSRFIRVNAMLEVENQVAAAVTGLLAILAMKHFGFLAFVVANIALYIVAVLCINAIPPVPDLALSPKKGPYFASLLEGGRVAWLRPGLSMMLAAASIPYVVVILFTVLHPVALAGLVDASGTTYALVEFLFAIGAIAGGLIVPKVPVGWRSPERALYPSLWGFATVTTLQALFPTYWGFLSIAFALGLGNAITRILRQSLLMEEIDAAEAGRIAAFLQGTIMLMRAILMSAMAEILGYAGTIGALWFTASIALLAPIAFKISCTIFHSRDRRLSPMTEAEP